MCNQLDPNVLVTEHVQPTNQANGEIEPNHKSIEIEDNLKYNEIELISNSYIHKPIDGGPKVDLDHQANSTYDASKPQ